MIHLWLICQINFFWTRPSPFNPLPLWQFPGSTTRFYVFLPPHSHTKYYICIILYYINSCFVIEGLSTSKLRKEPSIPQRSELVLVASGKQRQKKTWGIRNLIRTARSAKIFSHLEFHLAYCIKLGQTFGFPKFNHLMNIDKVLLREPIKKCPKRAKTQFLGPKTHVFFCKNGKD